MLMEMAGDGGVQPTWVRWQFYPRDTRLSWHSKNGGEDPPLILAPPDLSTLGREAGTWLEALLWSDPRLFGRSLMSLTG